MSLPRHKSARYRRDITRYRKFFYKNYKFTASSINVTFAAKFVKSGQTGSFVEGRHVQTAERSHKLLMYSTYLTSRYHVTFTSPVFVCIHTKIYCDNISVTDVSYVNNGTAVSSSICSDLKVYTNNTTSIYSLSAAIIYINNNYNNL